LPDFVLSSSRLDGWSVGPYRRRLDPHRHRSHVCRSSSRLGSWWSSATIALKVSRARPADGDEYRRLHNLVEGLCIAGGIPKPGVYVIDDDAPNAFATGQQSSTCSNRRDDRTSCNKMNRVELEGVVAHELSHIRHYDIAVSTIAVTLVGAIALMSDLALRTLWWNGGRQFTK
jgi:heat shock protein HtpX